MVKEKGTTNYLTAFVTVILALAFITAIASLTQERTNYTNAVNEVIDTIGAKVGPHYNVTLTAGTVANPPTGWRIEDCPLTTITVTNASGTALTVTTDYTLSSTTGVLNMVNSTLNRASFLANNNTLVSYSYCGDGYMNSSWGRTILNVNVGLYALAILIIVIILAYLYLKDND